MTTWTLGCDFSYDKPDLKALWGAGYRVILGYMSRTPGKGLTRAYVDQALALGFGILPLYETTADMALGGHSAGVAAASTATAIARELGCPADVPILYALDQDYSPTQMAGAVSSFVSGLHSVPGPDGEYAGYEQSAYLVKHGGDPQFQTYAWSSGRWLPSAQAPIEQYHNGVHIAGGTVDDCRVDLSRITCWEADEMNAADWTKLGELLDTKIAAAEARIIAEIGPQVFGFDPNVAGKGGIPTPIYQPDVAKNPTCGLGWMLGEINANAHKAANPAPPAVTP